jgi:hypothetical protein
MSVRLEDVEDEIFAERKGDIIREISRLAVCDCFPPHHLAHESDYGRLDRKSPLQGYRYVGLFRATW